MKLIGLAVLVVVVSPLAVGCGADPTCGDVDSLQSELDGMDPDDPDYNTTNEELNQAQAACNSSGGGY